MNAKRLSFILAVSSVLSTSALASEQSTEAMEQAELSQQQHEVGPHEEGGMSTQDVETRQIWPQRTEEFSTYLFVRTSWKVYNPNNQWVQINVRCERYGYDSWYWVAPYNSVQATNGWGCEGKPLYIFNSAYQYSSLYVQATVW
jgi:hypothetical protein